MRAEQIFCLMRIMKITKIIIVSIVIAVVVGYFLTKKNSTDLAFYCSFDSESALREKGSNYIKGAIVPGKIGNALSIPAHTAAAEFPLPVGVLGTKGCVEFWGRLDASKQRLSTCGSPRFFQIFSRNPQTEISCDWNCNNGCGGGGFTVRMDGTLMSTSQSMPDGWNPKVVLKDDVAAWHHYAFVWNIDGIKSLSSEKMKVITAVFVDGRLLMQATSDHYPDWKFGILSNYSSVLYLPDRLDEMPGYGRAPYSIDEFKIWKTDKTDFQSDK